MSDQNQTPVAPIMPKTMLVGTSVGVPVSLFVIWYLNTFVYPGKIPIEVATVVGGAAGQVVAVIWHIFQQLLAKAGIEI